MQLKDIVKILKVNVLNLDVDLNSEFEFAFTSDLMSDVLTRDYENTMLITGLANLQAIRTAEMSDIGLVIIGRDKEVSEDIVDLANKTNIILLKSPFSLFRISGILYEAGIKPVF